MTALIRIDRSWTPLGADGPRPLKFCSRCGQPERDQPSPARGGVGHRVCSLCGMGLMLTCTRDALPGAGAAFVVVRFDLSVSAVSEAGERIIGREQSLMGRSLLELVTSPLGDEQFARSVAKAATRPCDPAVIPVRLLSDRAAEVGTMAARVATCGLPRAALVTVEPTRFGRS
jgi:hypothetical protein